MVENLQVLLLVILFIHIVHPYFPQANGEAESG